jgi:hypothetical protein
MSPLLAKADIGSCAANVRFQGKSGHAVLHCKCPLATQSGHWSPRTTHVDLLPLNETGADHMGVVSCDGEILLLLRAQQLFGHLPRKHSNCLRRSDFSDPQKLRSQGIWLLHFAKAFVI